MIYRSLLRPIFFKFDPEKIHGFVTFALKVFFAIPLVKRMAKSHYHISTPKSKTHALGIDFPNSVGLAAGFDKNAELVEEMTALGFGFVEIGTVTPVGQPGNEIPRMFRLPNDHALINRMGFNNKGVGSAIKNLAKIKGKAIVGGNIGKNKITPNEDAIKDYCICFDALFPYVDYFVVNVSSPNTPDLRALQDKEPLKRILNELQLRNKLQETPKPIALKIAPDLSLAQLDDIIEIVKETGIAGIIATNTTISREVLSHPHSIAEAQKAGAGGLSGAPLHRRAVEVVRYLVANAESKYDVIGVGGIQSAQDALDFIEAGAKMVQVYTGFIYQGPQLVKDINLALSAK